MFPKNNFFLDSAASYRQELTVFSREVIRFGNRCKDSQWHNLDRYFSKYVLTVYMPQ
jgi:hypothetical protein